MVMGFQKIEVYVDWNLNYSNYLQTEQVVKEEIEKIY